MGVKVGRIVKEFVFKSLLDQQIKIDLHGNKKKLSGVLVEVSESRLELECTLQDLEKLEPDEQIRVFFYLQNNYHTFEATVIEKKDGRLFLTHPEGVYKNPQRKFERIKLKTPIEVFFTLQGKRVELNFPKAERPLPEEEPEIAEDFAVAGIQRLTREFRQKMSKIVSTNDITMMRNKIPATYEEKLMATTGKILWIPSVDEDFISVDPFPEERIITKKDLIKYEESFNTPVHIINSKLGNILYEKQKKKIFSEVYCPVLYDQYLVGYLYIANQNEMRKRISRDTIDYLYEFAKVLSYSLELNGYFTSETSGEQRYEAPIIDISAAGLLFAHTLPSLAKDLLIHTDIDLTIKFTDKKLVIGSRVRRKFKDNERCYFGVQFLNFAEEDFRYLFELLYGRPYTMEEEDRWEGGSPPPPLDLFE